MIEFCRSFRSLPRLVRGLLVVVSVTGFVAPVLARLVPGGGSKKSDCYVELNVPEGGTLKGKKLTCTDGDPTCDSDLLCDKKCTIKAALCTNQTNVTGCTPPSSAPGVTVKTGQSLTAGAAGACGADGTITVNLKKNGKKPGTSNVKIKAVATGAKPKSETDTFTFTCAPRTGACPTTTTTSTTSSTTSSTTPPCPPGLCGNNTLDAVCDEQCDGTAGGCGPGETCRNCRCVTCVPSQQACACGTTPTQFKFTTAVPAPGSQCGTTNSSTFPNLLCGSLYFGGGVVATTLPANLVDMSVSISNVSDCTGQCLELSRATSTDTGNNRNCTAKGCLFGAPLPVINQGTPALSTCIINSVSQNMVGEADCASGATRLNLPLNSDLYLTGDIDSDGTNGIQPCPTCINNKCHGGPNDGLACTPETSDSSALGEAFPTSQDCPPPPELHLPPPPATGALAIPFALTTQVSSKTAGPNGTQQKVFCGFCRDQDNPIGSTTFANPAVPCTSDADCAGVKAATGSCEGGDNPGASCTVDADCGMGGVCPIPTFDSCEQKDEGCLGDPNCTTITETGSVAGGLASHAPVNAKLVSVFCIPPAYNGPVDGAAGLPGPGAASLVGTVQVLP